MPDVAEQFLIDDRGMRCESAPELIELLLDYPDVDFDIVGYAIRNLGWIKVSSDPNSDCLHAEFRALTASFNAMSALCALVSERSWKAVVLEYDLFGWVTERYQDGQSAGARLRYIAQSVVNFLRHPAYTSKEKSLADLNDERAPESRTLAAVLKLWRDCGGCIPNDFTHKLREVGILPRIMLIDVESAGPMCRFQYIGSAFTVYGDDWPQEALGRNILDQPDKAYAEQVNGSCVEAFQSERPRYTHVDACIGTPGVEPSRSRYKCLKTAWRTARGNQVLLISSLLTPDVDIPLVPLTERQGH